MSSIYTAISGMRNNQQAMDVIANNIANVNTVAFKAGRVTFEETLVQTLSGAGQNGTNPRQVGLGVTAGTIDKIMSQGNPNQTGKVTDLAIVGDGFFIVQDGARTRYTRDGVFDTDGGNRLVMSSNGMSVLGWKADATTEALPDPSATPPSEIIIPLGSVYAVPTSTVNFAGNLDAAKGFGGNTSTTFSIIDSLGNQHQVNVNYTKVGNNLWTWSASSPDALFGDIGFGTIDFDGTGHVIASTGAVSLTYAMPNGQTSPQSFNLDFTYINQLDGADSIGAIRQDGLTMGTLENFSIDEYGVINGSFSNGANRVLGKIALAKFSNPAGLSLDGGNLWLPSANSGDPLVSTAENLSTKIRSGYLEMSNVDLATEFANMIVTQRAFQANSRTITTSDEMLQEVMSLKR